MQSNEMSAAAYNNRKKDAQLLYIMVFASSHFAALVELRAFIASKRDDFFANHVKRNCPFNLKERRTDYDC